MSLIDAMAYWRNNPVEAIKAWFGVTPEDYQADIINSLMGPTGMDRVTVKSAHGVGKTSVEAWTGWIYLMTRPVSRVVATAPTQSQLKDILWSEYAKWHQKMPPEFQSMWDISETHIRHKEQPKTWFAVARTSNKQENLQGFHGDNIFVQIDEASGVPSNVFEVIEGILTSADEHGLEAKLLMAGNPTQLGGEFYNSFNRNKLLYSRFTVSGDRTLPTDKNGGKIYLSRRVTEKYRATMGSKYGYQSAVYDVRVRGLFPTVGDGVVVPFDWAERAQYIELPNFDYVADGITLVMDVARSGGNETVLGAFRRGHCLWLQGRPQTLTNECVNMIIEAKTALEANQLRVIRIIVDEPGVGGGVIDVGRNAGLAITAYNGGAGLSAENGDSPDEIRMFATRRSRDWWVVRRMMESGAMKIPEDEELVNQLASLKYEYSDRDKIMVETKRKLRERLGGDATIDRADVIVMGCAPWKSLINATPVLTPEQLADLDYAALRPTAEHNLSEFS